MRARAWLLILLVLAGRTLSAAEGFESGTGIWHPLSPAAGTVRWHRVVAPACVSPHAGTAFMYFGRDGYCNYSDGFVKDASLEAGPFTLTNAAQAQLNFWLCYQVESSDPGCYDKLYLERSPDGSQWYSLADLSYTGVLPPSGGSSAAGYASVGGVGGPALWFQPPAVDLSPFLNSPLYLRFRFVSWAGAAGNDLCPGGPDDSYDSYLGYALDDISLGEGPPQLSLAKGVAPSAAAPGSAFTFNFTAFNGATTSADVALWDTLPAGALYTGGAVPPPSVNSGTLVGWNFPAVPAGTSATATLPLQVPTAVVPPQDWLNAASASAPAASASSNGVWARVRTGGVSVVKTVDQSSINSGDSVVYTLSLENVSASAQTVQLKELLPNGFVMGAGYPYPYFNGGGSSWNLTLSAGQRELLAVGGALGGLDGQVLTNTAQVWQGGAFLGSSSAAVTVHAAPVPQLKLQAIYPNPAPSRNPAFPRAAHIVYNATIDMPVTVTIYTLSGQKLRDLPGANTRGVHQVDWDLRNGSGMAVASGVYPVRVWSGIAMTPQPQAIGYLAVLR
jgi:uncharacterized repeat protein (TIGR01451 family)